MGIHRFDEVKIAGGLDMSSKAIENVLDPTSDQHGATKKYADETFKPMSDVAFHVVKDSTQTVSTATFTKVTWETEDYDYGSDFDLVNNEFVVPVNGLYLFGGCTKIDALNDQIRFVAQLFIDTGGGDTAWKQGQDGRIGNFGSLTGTWSVSSELNAGDQVSVYVYHLNGNDRTMPDSVLYNYFWGTQLA